ncbi:MAG: preprotein translocase subunit SecY [Trueperaceae bacterium]|nr:preprotein translocase subunit SecY [Trueperaceae bacterium]MCC6312216.1 preprotein translocase subunit SecY [Trueperaceae bacterium]MCO5174193.1 preprotein translocase subunit SecY [Trueperaceae bacterium]MCW5820067.1 preprotein translocase subunit SecY [Trueperaceae bacterium]
MLKAFRNALVIPDLRAKLLVTIGLLAAYRLMVHIPTPGVDVQALKAGALGGGVFSLLNFISGGNFEVFSIAALGVIPYITASIIIQLLQSTYPPLEKLSKEGEEGRRKITQYTRLGATALGAIQALFLAIALIGPSGALKVGWSNGPFFWFVVLVTQVAGITVVMWLGEKITEYGIGNGISLIIYAGIVAAFPGALGQQFALIGAGEANVFGLLFYVVLLVVAIAGMVLVQQAERRIPVQYARKVVGRKVMGGQTTYIPLRLNAAGVIPIIFAVAILVLPQTILGAFPEIAWMQSLASWFNPSQWQGLLLSTLLIVGFTYFYTQISFDPRRISENLREYGGFVPGVRPGQQTTEHLTRITNRITLWGALFLGLVNALPQAFSWLTGQQQLSFVFSGTGLLIMVGVALDTLRQLESQLMMRHYEGFVAKGRIRGRGRRF